MHTDNEDQFPASGKVVANTRPAAEIANVLAANVADTSIQPSVATEVSAANPMRAAELSPSSSALAAVPALEFAFDDEMREQIKPGSTTYDETPRLSGSAEIGAIVMIYDGDQVLGSVQAIDNGLGHGVWSFSVPAPLIAGDHELTVTATGNDGVESAHSDPFAITISGDLRPATIDIVYNDEGDSWKKIADGGAVRDTTPSLSGSGESGGIVSIYDGDTLLGTAIVRPLGEVTPGFWVFTPPELPVGQHVFTVTIKDGVDGVESPRSAPYTVNVEIAPTPSAPSIDSVSDGVGPVFGEVDNGGQTDDPRPSLRGRGEPGATVTISYGDQVLGTAQVQANGSWYYRAPSAAPLSDDTYTFVATQQIDNSQPSVPSLPFQIEVNTAPWSPTIDSIIDDVANAGGDIVVGKGGRTDDATPELQGRGLAGATVTISYGDQVLGTAQVDAKGRWSYQVPADAPLGDDTYTFVATQQVGNGSASLPSAPYQVEVAANAPAPAPTIYQVIDDVDNPGGGLAVVGSGSQTDDATPKLWGVGQAGAMVTISYGDQVLGTAQADSFGRWEYQVPADAPLADAQYAFVATQVGFNGQTSAPSEPYVITVLTEVPVAPTPSAPSIDSVFDNVGSSIGLIGKGDRTDDATPDLRGRGQPGATVTISYGDQVLGTAQVQANGSWIYRVPADAALGDGTYTFVATQQIDNSQPSVPSLPFQIEVNTAPWSPTIDNIIDDVANAGGDIVVGRSGRTDDATPELQGRGLAGATVTISYGDQVLGTAQVDAKGRWSYQVPADAPLGDDTYAFVATQQVGNGSASLPSAPYQVEVAANAPAPAPTIYQVIDDVSNPGGGLAVVGSGSQTDDATPRLWGLGQAGAMVTITYGDQVLGTAQADSFGRWEYQVPADAPLADAQYAFVATQVGFNGQTSAPSEPYEITVVAELPPPEPTPTLSAPEILSVWDDEGPITGEVGNGGSTDDESVLISGRGEPGAFVSISPGDGGNGFWIGVINIPVQPDGTWSHQLRGGELGLGANSIIVKQYLDGAESDWSEPYVVNLAPDPVAPPEPTPTLSAPEILSVWDDEGPITGEVGNGGSTDDRMVLISGTGEPGALLTLSSGKNSGWFGAINVPVGDDGSWSYQVPINLINDAYSLTVKQYLDGADSDWSEPYVIYVGFDRPVIESVWDDHGPLIGVVDNDGVTDDATPLLQGHATPGASLTINDGIGGQLIGVVQQVGADGRWSLQVSADLPADTYNLVVSQFDPYGNLLGTSEPYVVHIGEAHSGVSSVLSAEAPLNLEALLSTQAEVEEPAMDKLTLGDVLTTQTAELFAEAATPVAEPAGIDTHDLLAEGAWDASSELAPPADLGGVEYSTQQTGLVDQLMQDQIVTV